MYAFNANCYYVSRRINKKEFKKKIKITLKNIGLKNLTQIIEKYIYLKSNLYRQRSGKL